MYSVLTCSHAPRPTARRTRVVNAARSGRHSSGWRVHQQSWMVTVVGRRAMGGTTKLVPCTTSASPSQRSALGRSQRAQERISNRAGTGSSRVPSGNPVGRRRARCTRARPLGT